MLVYIRIPKQKKVVDILDLTIHDERKYEHDKCDLHPPVALCPSQKPVAKAAQKWHRFEHDPNNGFHTHQTHKVDGTLLQPVLRFGRTAVVARFDAMGESIVVGEHEAKRGEYTEEENKDKDTKGGLFIQLLVLQWSYPKRREENVLSCKIRTSMRRLRR